MPLLLEELKERIKENYDPDELVDILGISTEDLVEYLSDYIELNRIKFADIEEEEDDAPPWFVP